MCELFLNSLVTKRNLELIEFEFFGFLFFSFAFVYFLQHGHDNRIIDFGCRYDLLWGEAIYNRTSVWNDIPQE